MAAAQDKTCPSSASYWRSVEEHAYQESSYDSKNRFPSIRSWKRLIWVRRILQHLHYHPLEARRHVCINPCCVNRSRLVVCRCECTNFERRRAKDGRCKDAYCQYDECRLPCIPSKRVCGRRTTRRRLFVSSVPGNPCCGPHGSY